MATGERANAQQTPGLRSCPLVVCASNYRSTVWQRFALGSTAGSTFARFFLGCERLTGAQEEIERVPASLSSRRARGKCRGMREWGMRTTSSHNTRHAHNCLEGVTQHRCKTGRASQKEKRAYLTQLTRATLNRSLFRCTGWLRTPNEQQRLLLEEPVGNSTPNHRVPEMRPEAMRPCCASRVVEMGCTSLL